MVASLTAMRRYPLGTTVAPFGYWAYLPPEYRARAALPLLIYFHGLEGTGDGSTQLSRVLKHGPPRLIRRGTWRACCRHPFIVLAPQSLSGYPDPQEVHGFLKYAAADYSIDPSRVYLTGISAGAGAIWNYLNVHQDVSAVLPIAGRGSAAATYAERYCHIPIWAFHGSRDRQVPVHESIAPIQAVNATKCLGARARLTIYRWTRHNAWTHTYNLRWLSTRRADPSFDSFDENIYDWLNRHVR